MAQRSLFSHVEELLPHREDMVLIHKVLAWEDDWLEASVDLSVPSLFTQPDGRVPAWVGIEYMAQTIGALVGIRALENGRPIRIGFLMGTRSYKSEVPYFSKNSVLTIRVDEVFSDNVSLAVFDCKILVDSVLAQATIKAVQPDDPVGSLSREL